MEEKLGIKYLYEQAAVQGLGTTGGRAGLTQGLLTS
jgi:hypothetical protein